MEVPQYVESRPGVMMGKACVKGTPHGFLKSGGQGRCPRKFSPHFRS